MPVCLRVDMTQKKCQIIEMPKKYEKKWGRAFIASFCAEEVDPLCYPLGEKNKLLFTPGLLPQSKLPFAGRVTVGAKSPLTQGMAAANGGGKTAGKLVENGINALIIEGLPAQDELFVLEIDGLSARLQEAEDLRGKGVTETAAMLEQKYGKEAAITCIGPAGEMLLPTAAIANVDEDGHASRFCGRGGLGAVMGAKRIKAVVVTASPSKPGFGEQNTAGEKLGHFLQEKLKASSEAELLMRMCSPFKKTSPQVSSILVKPGTVQAFKTFCRLEDPRQIVLLNSLINDLGLDILETAAALGIFMAAEIIPWGDGEAAYELLKEIKDGSSLGLLLARGSKAAAEALGLKSNLPFQPTSGDTPYIKQEFYAQEPGDSYCAAQLFASARKGNLGKQEEDEYAVINCLLDSLGLSLYTSTVFMQETAVWDHLLEAINKMYGWQVRKEELINMSRQALLAEKQFNAAAGYYGQQNYLGGLDVEPYFYLRAEETPYRDFSPKF